MNADVHHLVTAYALDALDDRERELFESHLTGCADCRAELDGFEPVVTGLARAEATPPPADLRARVMAQIAETPQLEPVDAPHGSAPVVSMSDRRRRPVVWLASAAAVALLVVGAVVLVGMRGGDAVDDVRSAPDAVTLTLPATGDADASAVVEIVWSDVRDQVAVFADGLRDPGTGFVYELWAIAGGAPVPAGLFEPDAGSIREVADVTDFDDETPVAWGITIEPDGGSPAPTGDILYFAEV